MRVRGMAALWVLAMIAGPGLAQSGPDKGLTEAAVQESLDRCRIGACVAAVQDVLSAPRAAGLGGLERDVRFVMPLTTALAQAAVADVALAPQVAAGLGAAAQLAYAPRLVAVLEEMATHLVQGRLDAVDPAAIAKAVMGPAAGGRRKLSGGG